MEYINIKLETVGDFRYIGSKPVVRATWLNLLVYCAKQENSGRIANCRSWGNDTWAQIAGLRRSEVHTQSQLWDWDGADLVVWGYPIHNQEKCQTLRNVGRLGGKASGASRSSTKPEAIASPNAEPNASPNAAATLEQKEKEGKGKEENTTTTTTTAAPPILSRGCTLPEALDYATRYNAGEGLSAGRQITPDVVRLWHDSRLTTAWMNVKSGLEMPIADWQADLRTFAHRYTQNEHQRPVGGSSSGHYPKSKVSLSTTNKNGF